MFSTLISVAELNAERLRSAWRIVDCRFDLMSPEAAEAAYLASHIPGAVYAHLARDLSGPPLTDHGRHPLPSAARLIAVFAQFGIDAHTQVVAYDAASGGLAAARLWWLLRYMGHDRVAVLDGGWQAWLAAALPHTPGREQIPLAAFVGAPRAERVVRVAEVSGMAGLVDAREPRRFRGELEPIDPRAGHIPGAGNHYWQHNLDREGRFLAPSKLKEAFRDSLGTLPGAASVHYCGSGVSACHNVLAQVQAGLPEPRVYCGSWSEWCQAPERPAATGAA